MRTFKQFGLAIGMSLSLLNPVLVSESVASTVKLNDVKGNKIEILDVWARASVPGSPNSSAYFKIRNPLNIQDKLIKVSASIAEKTELHTHINDHGVMRMRKVESVLVEAQSEVTLKPMGYHVMFLNVKQTLKEGDQFPLTLEFERAGKMTVNVTVTPMKMHRSMHHHHH